MSIGQTSLSASAQAIPYSTPGTPITSSLPLFAQHSGDVIAYFVGVNASYASVLGLKVNGVATGVTGLNNQTSFIGQAFDLGFAPIGATLTPFINVLNTHSTFYSDASMNSDGISHAYEVTNNFALLRGTTYLGFEDLAKGAPFSDYDYNDAQYILTNASTTRPTILGTPAPTAGAGLVSLLGLAGAYLFGRRRMLAA